MTAIDDRITQLEDVVYMQDCDIDLLRRENQEMRREIGRVRACIEKVLEALEVGDSSEATEMALAGLDGPVFDAPFRGSRRLRQGDYEPPSRSPARPPSEMQRLDEIALSELRRLRQLEGAVSQS